MSTVWDDNSEEIKSKLRTDGVEITSEKLKKKKNIIGEASSNECVSDNFEMCIEEKMKILLKI